MSQIDTMKENARLREALKLIEEKADLAWMNSTSETIAILAIARAALQPETSRQAPVSVPG